MDPLIYTKESLRFTAKHFMRQTNSHIFILSFQMQILNKLQIFYITYIILTCKRSNLITLDFKSRYLKKRYWITYNSHKPPTIGAITIKIDYGWIIVDKHSR